MMNDLFTVCEGRCAAKFHASCVGVCEDSVCALTNNIIWMCDDCISEYRQARDRMPISKPETTGQSSIAAELTEIKSQIAAINSAMANMTPITAFNSTHRHSTPDTSPKPTIN